VKFGYRPSEVVVDIERLDIAAGERVAILGPVGGGKSTLIKLISTLYKPHSGSISIDGIDAFALAPEFIREHVSYLPQDVRLFQGSLRDNLTLGLPAPTDEEILAATQALGLDALIAEKAQGFDLPIQEGGRGLSGGQRQVVGLARMLLAKPQVLLLDEPTASMDAQLEARVIDHLFNALPQQSTVAVATHKAHVLKHVQRIVFVVGGRVVMDGPRDDVVRKLEGFFSRG
jgi:ATP-binding cassette subfamily C protein LapB